MSPRRSPPPAVVLFNRDLRVTDHPALVAASTGGRPVLALFVLDERILRARTTGPNRVAYLLEAVASLRGSLRALGGELVVRRGDPAEVADRLATAVGADEVHASEDVSATAQRRERDLEARAAASTWRLVLHEGVGVVAPRALRPTGGGDHYKVFTPYFRAWTAMPRRPVLPPPGEVEAEASTAPGVLPDLGALRSGGPAADPLGVEDPEPIELPDPSPRRCEGGEAAARARLAAWGRSGGPGRYAADRDDLGAAATSGLSADLHFGCLSPLGVERFAAARGGAEFVRQLCWRDFYLALTLAFPAVSTTDYRPGRRARAWRSSPAELDDWKHGSTGVELVDAAMRQLLEEGFVHNRARMVAASYLTKTLDHHWREGADHFLYWLTDGDVASNSGNWQWTAGTGPDSRPNRELSATRQARRFDEDGRYRRRYGPPNSSGAPTLFDPASPSAPPGPAGSDPVGFDDGGS